MYIYLKHENMCQFVQTRLPLHHHFALFVYVVFYLHILGCGDVRSHEGHWSLRPPHDLSYFYGEVSLASPQTPPVEGESSRSGWSAVTGAL